MDRSSLYLVGEPGNHSAAGRLARALPRRALSVEDVGAPSLARTVGRVVQVFPDGTSQLQLQRSPEGTFGFCVASGDGRRDSGMPPQLSGLHRPGFFANQDGAFWLCSEDSSEQWSSGLRELLIERTRVLPTGALSKGSRCGATGVGSCWQA